MKEYFLKKEVDEMRGEKGFTLIEIVMVIVLLGILSAVALPRFWDLGSKADESAAQGGIGGIRSGLSIYYASKLSIGAPQSQRAPSNPLSSDVIPDIYSVTGAPTAGGQWGYVAASNTLCYRLKSNNSQYYTWSYSSSVSTGAGQIYPIAIPSVSTGCP